MNWKDVGDAVGAIGKSVGNVALRGLGMAMGGPLGEELGGAAAQALGLAPGAAPDQVAAQIKADPQAAVKLAEIAAQKETAINKALADERIAMEHEGTERMTQVGQTQRAEILSQDKFVRWWRPAYGYSMAFTWTLQMLGITAIMGFAVVKHPELAGGIIAAIAAAISAMLALWAVALAVVGVTSYGRTKEKQVAAGQVPNAPAAGAIGALLQRFTGGPGAS